MAAVLHRIGLPLFWIIIVALFVCCRHRRRISTAIGLSPLYLSIGAIAYCWIFSAFIVKSVLRYCQYVYFSVLDIGVARILSGSALFFPRKVDDLFSRRPQNTRWNYQTRWNYLNNLSHRPDLPNFLKNGPTFPCKFCPPPNFFLWPGDGRGCTCTQCTPGYTYGPRLSLGLQLFPFKATTAPLVWP